MKGITIMQEIQLTLTWDEVNQILAAIGQQSYKDVFQLVAKIQQQAAKQLEVASGQADGSRPE
jgi:hypothetical protein